MQIWQLFVAGCAVILIFGCTSTAYKAPIKERSSARKPVVKVVKASPARPTPAIRQTAYVIQPGDTLFKIAFDMGLDYRSLASWNALADPGQIRAGDTLRLLSPVETNRSQIAAGGRPAAANVVPQPAPEPVVPEAPPAHWLWPAQGELVAQFNPDSGQKGIDLAGKRGVPVRATASGKVVYAGVGLRGYGKLIIIKHSQTLLSAYGHQEQLFVSEGKFVSQGERIGSMGDSDTDQVKLHFEIREAGKPVDPLIYLPKITS